MNLSQFSLLLFIKVSKATGVLLDIHFFHQVVDVSKATGVLLDIGFFHQVVDVSRVTGVLLDYVL